MKITLGEVGTYINGYAFKPSDWGISGLPIIRIQNLTNQNTIPNYFDGPYNSKFEVNKGDILIAWSGSLGIHVWQKNKALLNQHIFRVEFNKCEIDKMYFYYAVKYNIHKMLHLTHGATMRHIVKSDFEQIIIPYPSLDVQAKISKILNYLEQNIINYKTILSKLELLIKSRFDELIIGDKCDRLLFNDLFFCSTGKLDSNAAVKGGRYPFFTCAKEIFYINDYAFDQEALLLAGNNAAGKYDVKYYNGKFNAYQRTYVLSLRKKGIYSIFKKQLEDKLEYLQIQSKGSTTRYLTMGILKKLTFYVPDMEIQLKLDKEIQQINKLKSDVQKSIDETQLLMDSLMQEYFG